MSMWPASYLKRNTSKSSQTKGLLQSKQQALLCVLAGLTQEKGLESGV